MSTPIIVVGAWSTHYPADELGYKDFLADAIMRINQAKAKRDPNLLGVEASTWYGAVQSFMDSLPLTAVQKNQEIQKGIAMYEGAYEAITGRSASAFSWPWDTKQGLPGRAVPGSMPQPTVDYLDTARRFWSGLPPIAKVGLFAGIILIGISILSGESR